MMSVTALVLVGFIGSVGFIGFSWIISRERRRQEKRMDEIMQQIEKARTSLSGDLTSKRRRELEKEIARLDAELDTIVRSYLT